MNLKDIEKRMSELDEIVKNAQTEEEINNAIEERKSLNEKKVELEKLEARRAQAMAIQNGQVIARSIETPKANAAEVRNSEKYINAYAEYIKTGKDAEVRSLLTENVTGSGTIAVPDFVYDIIKTSWDKNEIMSRVKKVSVKGNLKVQFEISGTDAVFHDEGSGAVAEETLTEGIVTMVPANIKKWISFSDEVMSMRGVAFLNYIYDELTQKIVKKMADTMVAKIEALDGTGSSTAPKQSVITVAPAMATVATAIGNLCDEATNPVIIMNKLTFKNFKTVQYANGYGADPFENLTVLFNSTLPAYDTASTNDTYMIVGDLGYGALANFPNGEVIDFKFDELTRKKEDMIEVLGKEYVAIEVIACKAFTKVKKPAAI